MGTLTLKGNDGNDTFQAVPPLESDVASFVVDGGSPTAAPGDSLQIDTSVATDPTFVTASGGASPGPGRGAFNWSGIESGNAFDSAGPRPTLWPPSTPTGVAVTGVTSETSLVLLGTPSDDNVGVTRVRVFSSLDGGRFDQDRHDHRDHVLGRAWGPRRTTSSTWCAKDAAGNTSGQSQHRSVKTANAGTGDTSAPTPPTELLATGATARNRGTARGTPPPTTPAWSATTCSPAESGKPFTPRAGLGRDDRVHGDLGLLPGTDYGFFVVAKDAAGNASMPSNTATATTAANTGGDTSPPTAPADVRSTGTTSTSVDLAWTLSNGIDDVGVVNYDVLVRTPGVRPGRDG